MKELSNANTLLRKLVLSANRDDQLALLASLLQIVDILFTAVERDQMIKLRLSVVEAASTSPHESTDIPLYDVAEYMELLIDYLENKNPDKVYEKWLSNYKQDILAGLY